MKKPRERVIICTDSATGFDGLDPDDGFALFYALKAEGIDVLGIVTTYGNTTCDHATLSVLKITERAGVGGVPIRMGATRPLATPEFQPPVPTSLAPKDERRLRMVAAAGGFVDFLRETILANPGQVTLVSIGPLTTFAILYDQAPEVISKIKRLVMMGGAFGWTADGASPVPEYNVWLDPQAAARVLTAPVPAVIVPLDVTMRVRLARERLDAMRPNPVTNWLREVTYGWFAEPFIDGAAPMHDALAVEAIVRPELFDLRELWVGVESDPKSLAYGMTFGFAGPSLTLPETRLSRARRMLVALGVDAGQLLDELENVLESYYPQAGR